MANNNNGWKRKVSRQNWRPSRPIVILRGLWTAAYSVLKIALGALVTVLLIAGVCMVVFVSTLGDYLQNDILPNADADLDAIVLDQTSYAYYLDSDGNIQTLQQIYADVKQEWVDYEDIPKHLIHAAVAIEDHRFFEHQGVDWFTTVKACVNMFVGARDQFGGSSITQQLIKNYFKADDVTVQRKVLEIFRATELEKRYDKNIIMEYYLNIIFLGERCNGVKAAAATYFGKELEHLTAAECAGLISITNNPSLYNPYRTTLDKEGKTGMEQNDERRINTLWRMHNLGYLTDEEYAVALEEKLVLKRGIDDEDRVADCENENCLYHGKVGTFEKKDDGKYYCPKCGEVTTIGENASQTVYSYFMDTVLEDVAMALAEKNGVEWNKDTKKAYMQLIGRSGYHIYTTLDMDVQNEIDRIYTDLNQIPADRSLMQLQSGIVVIDNVTGDIVGMAGGVGEKTTHDGFNRATDAKLQPGSSFKPLTVYAPGFELGLITPASVAKDLPLYYNEERPYPYNDGRDYSYSRTILDSVRASVNAVAVNTLDSLGLGYSYNFATQKFGISTLVKEYINSNNVTFSDESYSPLALGAPTFGVTLRDMSNAYATFANNGVFREARTFTKVYNSKGELVLDNTQDTRQILSEKTVNYMNYCLSTAVKSGTGTEAQLNEIGMPSAGKTGSTASYKDRWFCGFTPHYTAAVWSGYDTPEVINMVYGGNPSSQLWKKVMVSINKGLESKPLYDDEDMIDVTVCLDCGKLATDACTMEARTHNTGYSRVATAKVFEEDAPLDECDCHVVVDFCESCNAVANEYCKKLAAVGRATITKRSLVKLTKNEVSNIAEAAKNGLWAGHIADNYIYLVDSNENPINDFKGLNGDKNEGVKAPYLVCDQHTKADWQEFLSGNPGYEEEKSEDKDKDKDKNQETTKPTTSNNDKKDEGK